MVLTREELIEVLSEDTVNKSTYTLCSRTYIRLFNSREDEAHIPALYPNTKEYKNKLALYSNVTNRRADQIGGIRVNNRKTDLELSYKEREDIFELPELPKSCQDLIDKMKDPSLDTRDML